jgi:hypothetical protein
MVKVQLNQILVKGAKLSANKLNGQDPAIIKLIEITKEKQVSVLKLKEVDQESLKMIVQL